ncbi:CPBP family glutamic-type intramembrane protease [Amylolactobacillus amylophilus]
MGVIFSALIFALLNFSSIPLIFISELLIGGLLAWSYLSTQSLWVPVLLAIFNGVLTVVLL